MTACPADIAHMRAALSLAARGLGNTWPNPAVGCVLVQPDAGAGAGDGPESGFGRVVGRGWTQPGGRPHAETEALARAGEAARGATAYVTLEPCSHYGVTPPCADALIAAGIARCVVAITDSDLRVSGGGLARLREAGIAVTEGVLAAEARALNAGFFHRIETGRPLLTLKVATSLDGRIATATGESQWITGPPARRLAHLLRATHDAVLIGSGTAIMDDPALTVRLPGLPVRPPVRVVVDARLRLPITARLIRTAAEAPLWLVTSTGHSPDALAPYRERGVEVLEVVPGSDRRPQPAAMMAALAERGLTRVLCEGGGEIAAALVRAQVVDQVAWFRAGRLLGGDGRPAIGALGLDRLDECPNLAWLHGGPVGDDRFDLFSVQS